MWILQGAHGEEALSFRLSPRTNRTIGRATGADFVVDAPLVSRLHCRLEAGEATLDVVDLSSTNGTFVNDKRIARAPLTKGDRLRVGRVELTVAREAS